MAALPPTAVAVRLRQRGEMRQSPDQAWSSFKANQVIAIDRIAFAWAAKMRLIPALSVQIIDAYDGTHGLLAARLGGILPLTTATGRDVDKGEIQRYLAELPWVPGALARNPQLGYREAGDSAVIVVARSGKELISLTLQLDEIGRIAGAQTDARPRIVNGRLVPTPWRGRFSDWRDLNGFEVPTRAEVEWVLEGGPFPCWRGEIIGIDALDSKGAVLSA